MSRGRGRTEFWDLIVESDGASEMMAKMAKRGSDGWCPSV